jgi:hypothetical protein
MAQYRLPELDLSTRMQITVEMVLSAQERGWGRASQLAQQYGVSRALLYEWRDKAVQSLQEILQPHDPGPRPHGQSLEINSSFIQRAIALWPMLTGSVRGIQTGLELLLGVKRSVGYISQTLQAAGQQATAYNQAVVIPLPILGEADEIFQGRQPCLTVVDGRSFLVLNLTPAESRDGTTWGLTYLDLVERGIQFQDLACDGGTGLRAGVREAKLALPLRPDLFHLLQEAYRLTRRLEGTAYRAIAAVERAQRAEWQAQGLTRRRGRRLTLKIPLAQAQVEAAQAIATFDTWSWLLAEVRQALEPLTPTQQLVAVAKTKATLETAIALLKEVGHADITAFADDLQQKLPELLAPLAWLEQHLTPLLQNLTTDTQAFVLWTWQHRHTLNLNLETDLPASLRSIGPLVWETLGLFHRSSSLAESLHSWLRPHLQLHRGMPQWLLPLLQLFWNHHEFERGKRSGSSPLQLAGVPDALSLAQVLDQLFRPTTATQPG